MNHYRYVLVGGGVASVHASMGIREYDQGGRILLLGDEPNPPTDRPPLSKQFLIRDDWNPDDPESKASEYYEENAIDLALGVRAQRLDRAQRTIYLSNDRAVQYDRLLVATGTRPATLNAPGIRLDGVMTFRSIRDAIHLRDSLRSGNRVVVIGGGLLGNEIAAACALRGVPTTLLVSKSRMLADFGSEAFGRFVEQQLRDHGVEIIFDDHAVFFAGSGKLKSVHTESGGEIDANTAVIAIGVVPNSEWLNGSGIELMGDGGVVADRYLQTNDSHVWAAGDIACHDDAFLGGRYRFEHHLNAKWQGRVVGATMAGVPTEFNAVPYIYSDVFDYHINLRGKPISGEPTKVIGSHADGEFIELYASSCGRLRSALSVSRDDERLDRISDQMEKHLIDQALVEAVDDSILDLVS